MQLQDGPVRPVLDRDPVGLRIGLDCPMDCHRRSSTGALQPDGASWPTSELLLVSGHQAWAAAPASPTKARSFSSCSFDNEV
jgi:hypothetical protein